MLARLHKEPAPHAPSASWFFGNAANDANGNLPHRNKTLLTTASTDPTTLRGMTLAYDSLNRLTTLNGSTTYAYNALNQRTSKTVNGITTYFVYGLGGELLAETTAGNDTDYVYLDGTPLAQVRSNQVYYIHTDPLGLPSAITDARQTLVWYWDADPYGTSSPVADLNGTDVNFTFNLRFPGQYFDTESGLHYNYYRYYDPQTGRYITSDPMGLGGGLNTYGYVGGNPLRYSDRYGLRPCVPPSAALCAEGCNGVGKLVEVCTEDNWGFTYFMVCKCKEGSSCPKWPGNDPAKAPEGTEWRGEPGSTPGSSTGNYYNPITGESYRPDLGHSDPVGPHWDYRDPSGQWHRIFPNNTTVPK